MALNIHIRSTLANRFLDHRDKSRSYICVSVLPKLF
jgi:hypothetical protein